MVASFTDKLLVFGALRYLPEVLKRILRRYGRDDHARPTLGKLLMQVVKVIVSASNLKFALVVNTLNFVSGAALDVLRVSYSKQGGLLVNDVVTNFFLLIV